MSGIGWYGSGGTGDVFPQYAPAAITNTGSNSFGDTIQPTIICGVIGWDGVSPVVWTPTWVPTVSDPAPTLSYPNGGAAKINWPGLTYPKGTLSLTATVAGVPQNTLVLATTNGGSYGNVAWALGAGITAFTATPSSGNIAWGPSVGLVGPQPPRLTGPVLFSQLPLAARVYTNDYVLVYQGTPPIARQIAVSTLLATTTPGTPLNTEQKQAAIDRLISQLSIAPSGNLTDFILVNQGKPPQTRRVALVDFINELNRVS